MQEVDFSTHLRAQALSVDSGASCNRMSGCSIAIPSVEDTEEPQVTWGQWWEFVGASRAGKDAQGILNRLYYSVSQARLVILILQCLNFCFWTKVNRKILSRVLVKNTLYISLWVNGTRTSA